MADMWSKGRQRNAGEGVVNLKGADHLLARLSEDGVREIVALYRSRRFTQRQLAERYHVRQQHISNIVRGNRWPDLWESSELDDLRRAIRVRLTSSQAEDIRIKHAAGVNKKDLAAEYGVHYNTIGRALRGEIGRPSR